MAASDHGTTPEITLTDRFQHAMRLMRRHHSQAQEDGFDLLRPHAAEHLDELLAAFTNERDDHGLRCWLLELIGEARSPQALPVLVERLHSGHESLRSWAIRGLESYRDDRRVWLSAQRVHHPDGEGQVL